MSGVLMILIGSIILWAVIEGKAYALWNAVAYGGSPTAGTTSTSSQSKPNATV